MANWQLRLQCAWATACAANELKRTWQVTIDMTGDRMVAASLNRHDLCIHQMARMAFWQLLTCGHGGLLSDGGRGTG